MQRDSMLGLRSEWRGFALVARRERFSDESVGAPGSPGSGERRREGRRGGPMLSSWSFGGRRHAKGNECLIRLNANVVNVFLVLRFSLASRPSSLGAEA